MNKQKDIVFAFFLIFFNNKISLNYLGSIVKKKKMLRAEKKKEHRKSRCKCI